MKYAFNLPISKMFPAFLLAAFYFFNTACGGGNPAMSVAAAGEKEQLIADTSECEIEFDVMSVTPAVFFEKYDKPDFGRMDFVFQNQKNGDPFNIDSYSFKATSGNLIDAHFLSSKMISYPQTTPYVFTDLGFTKAQIDAYITKLQGQGINLRTVQEILFLPFVDMINGIAYMNIKIRVVLPAENSADLIKKLINDEVSLMAIGPRETKLNPCPPNKPGT